MPPRQGQEARSSGIFVDSRNQIMPQSQRLNRCNPSLTVGAGIDEDQRW